MRNRSWISHRLDVVLAAINPDNYALSVVLPNNFLGKHESIPRYKNIDALFFTDKLLKSKTEEFLRTDELAHV